MFIKVEINNNKECWCRNCRFKKEYETNNICILFQTELQKNIYSDLERCDECINAELLSSYTYGESQ